MKATPDNAGCWIDGHWGHYSGARLIQIATSAGWDDTDAFAAAERYMKNEPELDEDGVDLQYEHIWDAADEAEVWMNEHIAPEGYSFGWHDGEYFLWKDSEWEETQ